MNVSLTERQTEDHYNENDPHGKNYPEEQSSNVN